MELSDSVAVEPDFSWVSHSVSLVEDISYIYSWYTISFTTLAVFVQELHLKSLYAWAWPIEKPQKGFHDRLNHPRQKATDNRKRSVDGCWNHWSVNMLAGVPGQDLSSVTQTAVFLGCVRDCTHGLVNTYRDKCRNIWRWLQWEYSVGLDCWKNWLTQL